MRNKKLREQLASKRGHIPGVAKYVGQAKTHEITMEMLRYNCDDYLCESVSRDNLERLPQQLNDSHVMWLNVNGVHDTELLETIGQLFDLHPLVIEDIANTNHRPKLEAYENYIYIVLKMLQWNQVAEETTIEQISLILGKNFVLSFQQHPGDVFGPIRKRISGCQGRVRKLGADYLCYCLTDAIVDEYFSILEHRGEQIDSIEDEVMDSPKPETLQYLHKLKREGLFIRKSIWPVREIVSQFERLESSLVSPQVQPYLRDVYDHVVAIVDTSETMRDMISAMRDTYLSSLSNRMNEIMKVLTIISTIFIPITFIAGIYGMNFEYMPECKIKWAYPAVWVIILVTAGAMFRFFRKRRWL